MAVVADVAAGNMRGSLAGRGDAIVTRAAGPDNLGVIDSHYGHKNVRAVAIFANICCLNMRRILADRVRAVMTAGTIATDIHVIEIRWQPGDRAMAVIAIVTAGNMRRVFAGRSNAVMAGAATAKHLGVINHQNGCKHTGGVAIFADISRLHVCRVFAGRVGAVMAVYAIACDGRVVEECRQPACRTVAVVAGVGAGDMCRGLADGRDAVMAGIAGSDDLGVVDGHHGRKHIRGVAVFANIRRSNMRRVLTDRVRAIVATDTVTADIHMIKVRG